MTTQLAVCEPRAGAHAEPALHPGGGSRREPLSSIDGRACAWMGQDGEAVADAPHASSRARRVERRLVGASDGAETPAQHVNATSTAQAKAWRPRPGGDGTDSRVSFGHTSAGVEQVDKYGRPNAAERLR